MKTELDIKTNQTIIILDKFDMQDIITEYFKDEYKSVKDIEFYIEQNYHNPAIPRDKKNVLEYKITVAFENR